MTFSSSIARDEGIYLSTVNRYRISFLRALTKKIESMFESHFLVHYVIVLDNDDEHYKKEVTHFFSVILSTLLT